MLHKSFKPAKCKTSLNLAKSRIKLLKNKKEVQVKQLRRELAQLLESGQDQTARIRVEHVVREEKTMAAYELIEIYCELIVARLPIIESQKNCPLDLKEAITSLIFAAPRCGDIPELQDVRKHFTTKYGKEFVAAAIELRPACGVSRTMVEKLSVKAPDGPTKVKILTAIAEEHDIKWEPQWFKDEVEVPSTHLLKVQHTEKEKVNVIQMEPLKFEISDDPPEWHANDAARPATSSQSHVRADIDASAVPQSASSRIDTRLGSSSEKAASSQPSATTESVLSTSRQSWNMEFKDATAAAQAAAESAERASMAARAAAQLSTHGRIINDTSSGPVASSVYGLSEGSGIYTGSVFQQEYVERNHTNSSFNHRSLRMQGVQQDANEQGNMKKGAEARTFKEEYKQYGIEGEDFGESKSSSYPVQDMRRQSRDSLFIPSTSRAESSVFVSSNQEFGNEPAENPFHEEIVKMENQPSSFQSQSSAFEDEYSIFSQVNNQNENDRDDGSLGNFNQGTANYDDWHLEDPHHSGAYDVMDDLSFREQRERVTFLGSDEQKHEFQSRKDIFVNTDRTASEMDVEEMGTRTDSCVVFDESGSDDDEYDINHVQKSFDLPSPGKSSPNKENSPENQGNQSSFSRHPPYGLEVSESFRESPIYAKLSEPVPIAFDSDGASSGSEKELQNEIIEPQKSPQSLRLPSHSSDPVSEFHHETQSSPEVGTELNFGQLLGGRRNKPLLNPPYTRTAVDNTFDASRQSKASFDKMENPQSPKETSVAHTQFASTSDDPDVVTVQKASNITERPYSVRISENVYNTNPKSPAWYFDSDDSGSEDTPKQSVTSKTLLGAGLSRRTKASARRSVARSQTPVASVNIPEDPPNLQAEATGFRSRDTDSLRWDDEAISRPRPQRIVSKSKEEENLSPSVAEESVNPPKGAEPPRASSSNEKAPSRENSIKNPSHVHPKLPDFESFTAHLQSLRTNRR